MADDGAAAIDLRAALFRCLLCTSYPSATGRMALRSSSHIPNTLSRSRASQESNRRPDIRPLPVDGIVSGPILHNPAAEATTSAPPLQDEAMGKGPRRARCKHLSGFASMVRNCRGSGSLSVLRNPPAEDLATGGHPAESTQTVSIPSFPEHSLIERANAHIRTRRQHGCRRIGDEPEFTPRNVATAEERLNTFYPVEIRLPNPERLLKPGMPADATF